jgi:purine-nucleoside phosphorylase
MTQKNISLFDQIQASHQFILTKIGNFQPEIGIILGTGLGNLTQEITVLYTIPYADIPHFPTSTVESHKGELVFGALAGRRVVAMSGRFHYYEGYSMQQVTFPIRVLNALKIKELIISNAAGSTSPHIKAGDIVFAKDHINLQPENPLRGENDERLGPRFPDMLPTYNKVWNARALAIAAEEGIRAHEGVYVALQGPNLETPAEYVFLHHIGADVVGMSSVPEVIVARHSGLRVLMVSVVSNQSYPPEVIRETTLEEVIAVVTATEPKLTRILKALLVDK